MSTVVTAHPHNIAYSIYFDNETHILTDRIWLCVFILAHFGRCVHFHCIITDKIQRYHLNHAVMAVQTIK